MEPVKGDLSEMEIYKFKLREPRSRVAPFLAMALLSVFFLAGDCDGGGDGGGDPDPSTTGEAAGAMTVPGRVILDFDTRDPNNPQADNDSLLTAQNVSNLSTIVGHVEVVNDVDDFFSTTLAADEKIVLKIADEGADLDLYLYDDTGVLVDGSTSAALIEQVTAAADGLHYIRVRAYSSGSIYNLGLGLDAASVSLAGVNMYSPDDEFIIGDAIIKFKPDALPASAAAGSSRSAFGVDRAALVGQARARASELGVELAAVDPYGRALVSFEDDPSIRQVDPAYRANYAKLDRLTSRNARRATLEKIHALSRHPSVEWVEPNLILKPVVYDPDDQYRHLQWNLDAINMTAAWQKTTGLPEATVAIIDTGVLYDHPDLSGNILRDETSKVVGYDMIANPLTARDGDGPDSDPYDTGDLELGSKSSFHGSHCAGIAAAVSNNLIGVAGVAPGVKIMPIRVLGQGGGSLYDVAQGILYAAGLPNAYGALPRINGSIYAARIISLSLGGTSGTSTLLDAVTRARDEGLVIIAAAGNSDTSAPFYPAAYPGVVSVSAVDYVGNLAPYSNFGSSIDLAAPGGNMGADLNQDGYGDGILSTVGDDSGCAAGDKACYDKTYSFFQGTSMAAPHVAGVVALMISAFDAAMPGREFRPVDLDQLITGTADNSTIGSITNYPKGVRDNQKGYGVIDADKAVSAALVLAGESVDLSPVLDLQPAELNFGFINDRMEALAVNRGFGTLDGITVLDYTTADNYWLSHILVGATVIFDVNREGLADGGYEQTVTVNSNGGSDTVRVTMNVGPILGSNVGTVYVILIETETLETKYQTTTSLGLGYAFAFKGIAPGEYFLLAGTDLDDDYYLGDNGELFGVYPNIGGQQKINIVAGKLAGNLDFPLQFVGLPVQSMGVTSGPTEGPAFYRLPY